MLSEIVSSTIVFFDFVPPTNLQLLKNVVILLFFFRNKKLYRPRWSFVDKNCVVFLANSIEYAWAVGAATHETLFHIHTECMSKPNYIVYAKEYNRKKN